MSGYDGVSTKPRTLRSRISTARKEATFSAFERTDVAHNSEAWQLIDGDDILTPQVADRHQAWIQTQELAHRSTLVYQDPGFLPGPKAVDGRAEVESRTDIFKATLSESAVTSMGSNSAKGEPPLCKCGQAACCKTMQKGTATGRQYWSCSTRQCKFFEFVDQRSTLAALEVSWAHLGPPEWCVVGDEGFCPEHLRQGGLGDCWFMSALAVVAERHDLLEKLLPNLNDSLASGCHEVRLFLDGRWTAALIDSYFPLAAPSKQKRQDETGLAFGRASGHQLWVPLLEKAYARAHGAYNSISGGQVSEAMLDLTGCPTESINFRMPGFDTELFWGRLLSFVHARFPVGCGTNAETVEELGLVGQHAYSVLDASERPANWFDPDAPPERMVKVRNPWGEWTRREYDEILQSLGANITDDGSFWMPYCDFIRGFGNAEVCKALPGWHSRSFEVGFHPSSGTGMRRVLRLEAVTRTECYIMAIQPTDRGAQLKRARGYLLNDVSYSLLCADSGALEVMNFGGALRDVMGDSCWLEAGKEYIIVPFSFKARPGGCVLRIYSSQNLRARLVDCSADDSANLWMSVHTFAMQRLDVVECRVQRMVHRLFCQRTGQHLGRLIVLEAHAMAVGIVINESMEQALQVDLLLEASQMIARTQQGISEGTPQPSASSKPQRSATQKGKGKGKDERKEDWHEFVIQAVIPPVCQQLVFAMIPCTRLHGDYDLSLMELRAERVAQNGIPQVVGGAFAAVAIFPDALSALPGCEEVGAGPLTNSNNDAELLAAISASLAESALTDVAEDASSHDLFDVLVPCSSTDSINDASGTLDAEMELALAMSLADAQTGSKQGDGTNCISSIHNFIDVQDSAPQEFGGSGEDAGIDADATEHTQLPSTANAGPFELDPEMELVLAMSLAEAHTPPQPTDKENSISAATISKPIRRWHRHRELQE